MEDEKIIELFFDRSETAIEALSEKYGKLCLYLANNILRQPQEAEECVNDTYLGVWNTIPPQHPQHLKSFVCRIVHHLACKRVEHEQAQKRQSNYRPPARQLSVRPIESGGTPHHPRPSSNPDGTLPTTTVSPTNTEVCTVVATDSSGITMVISAVICRDSLCTV